jgi:hypothetical protein
MCLRYLFLLMLFPFFLLTSGFFDSLAPDLNYLLLSSVLPPLEIVGPCLLGSGWLVIRLAHRPLMTSIYPFNLMDRSIMRLNGRACSVKALEASYMMRLYHK